MMGTRFQGLLVFLLISAYVNFVFAESVNQVLFEFGDGFETNDVITSDCQIEISGNKLAVKTGHNNNWPGITLKATDGKWDLTDYQHITSEIKNTSNETVVINLRVDNPGADGSKNCVTDNVSIEPGETGKIIVTINGPWVLSEPLELVGMRGNPEAAGAGGLDSSNIVQLILFVNRPGRDYEFEVGAIRAEGKTAKLDAKSFLPFIDKYGQFIHSDWPGKVKSDEDLKNNKAAEDKEFSARPGPEEWDEYGGWAKGPKLEGTGFFRVEKYNGKWWLVDPAGRLFWSHGIDCVHYSSWTPISDRENYFEYLPEDGFYGSASWAPHGYYSGKGEYKTYDFCQTNLLRKYGANWREEFSEVTHKRLKSWGMNTIANWSDRGIYLMRKTPYVATIGFNSKVIEGSEGYWSKFPDPFEEDFRNKLRRIMEREKGKTAGDKWCLGFFVHNELGWGDETSLAVAAMMSGGEQAAKREFVKDLREKYETIKKFNASWGGEYGSWEDVLKQKVEVDKDKASDDLKAFYTRIAEKYFEVIREEVKRAAPEQLYLGCRFAWVNDRAVLAAGKYCDVVSFNRYNYSVEKLGLPGGLDKPVIIGEFHFGALDRGMFHTGLKKAANQADRGRKYESYVKGALRNRYIVGTHWFQYKDQATTGRGDGENYQIGFVDICDTPYAETIESCREVGYNLYEYRSNER